MQIRRLHVSAANADDELPAAETSDVEEEAEPTATRRSAVENSDDENNAEDAYRIWQSTSERHTRNTEQLTGSKPAQGQPAQVSNPSPRPSSSSGPAPAKGPLSFQGP